MANENIAMITGTLGKDPDLRYTAGGQGVCTFSVATNRRWMDKKTQEWQEDTTWHNVVVWGELGENCAASLAKGLRVTVTGRIANRSYEDKEGVTKYISEIVADSVAAELRFATAEVSRTERKQGGGSAPADAPLPDGEPF